MDGVQVFTLMSTTANKANSKSANKSKLIQNVESLKDLLDLMNEKQLRVRTAEEEVLFMIDNKEVL